MEVLFEFTRIGPVVKVTAIDPETLTEVSVQCPASADESVLKASALRRLMYVMKKNQGHK